MPTCWHHLLKIDFYSLKIEVTSLFWDFFKSSTFTVISGNNGNHRYSYIKVTVLSFPGSEYVVAGHKDWKTGWPTVNAKSLVKPWKSSLGRKFLHILRKVCGHR